MSDQIKKQNTIDYYNKNAASFAQSTASVDFHEVQDKFLTYMPEGAKILDFGCGAGRDAKYFAEKGFEVVAVDGSEELCKVARSLSGITVRQMLFADLDETESYDGIWACASILHLPMAELRAVFRKMINAIKPGGYIYTSFKYGTNEGYRGERYFIDFTEKTFETFCSQFPEIALEERWVSKDVRPGRENEKWLNAIMKKTSALSLKPVIAGKFTFEHYLKKVIETSLCNPLEINYQLEIIKPLLEDVFPEYQIPDTSNNSEGKSKSHCRYYYTLKNQSAPDLLIAKNYVYENLWKKPQVFAAVEVKQQCGDEMFKKNFDDYRIHVINELASYLCVNPKAILTNCRRWEFFCRKEDDGFEEDYIKGYLTCTSVIANKDSKRFKVKFIEQLYERISHFKKLQEKLGDIWNATIIPDQEWYENCTQKLESITREMVGNCRIKTIDVLPNEGTIKEEHYAMEFVPDEFIQDLIGLKKQTVIRPPEQWYELLDYLEEFVEGEI